MSPETRRLWHASVLAFLAVSAAIAVDAQRQGGPAADQPVEGLRFRYMGPPSAGRIAAVAGIPGDTKTYYAGAASGGVWKTTDGGQTFEPIFDDQPVQAIGALAVAPSNPNIVWAGHRRGVGHPRRRRDGRRHLQVDRRRQDVDEHRACARPAASAASSSTRPTPTSSSPARSAARRARRRSAASSARPTAAKTWQRVLFVNPNTGCSGLAMDPKDPNIAASPARGRW